MAHTANRPLTYEEQMEDFEKNVIGTREAAQLLGISHGRMTHLLAERKVIGKRIGREWAVFLPSLQGYINSRSGLGRPISGKPKIRVKNHPSTP